MSEANPTKPTYRSMVSSIPSSITYCSNSIYLICQLRRTSTDTSAHAATITEMYENGSASTVIRSLILETFKTQPIPSTLQHAIDIREIFFLSLQGASPTYSVRFSALLPSSATSGTAQTGQTYAKNGSPQSTALREFLYSMVYERWHTKSDSIATTLDISQPVVNAAFFLVPPLNYPKYRPVAYLSGLPPSLFGRKVTHTSLLVSSIHEAVKKHLDPAVNSKLFHLEYFKQAFGLKVKTAHLFRKDLTEEVYLVYMSNNSDLSVLSKILYSSDHILLTMGLPTTFFPIAPRPDSNATPRQNATYYGAIDRILEDIRMKRDMLTSLPSIIIPFVKHPFTPSTRNVLLNNANITSYSVFHLHNQHQQTKLFLKRPLKKTEAQSIIRSWFTSKERNQIFAPLSSPQSSLPPLPPDSIMLNSVIKQCPRYMKAFAAALGVPVPTPPIMIDTTSAPPTTPVTTVTNEPNIQSPDQSAVSGSSTLPSTTDIMSPPKTRNILNPPRPALKRRQAHHSPDHETIPPITQTTIPNTSVWGDDDDVDDNSTATQINDPTDDDDEDHEGNTYSIRLTYYENQLVNHIPTTLRKYIDHNLLTSLTNSVYIASDTEEAIHSAKFDIRQQVDRTEHVILRTPARGKKKNKHKSPRKKSKV